MKKLVQMLMPLVAIVAMALPLSASAQVTVPYTTGFEAADDTAWTFVNDATNQ